MMPIRSPFMPNLQPLRDQQQRLMQAVEQLKVASTKVQRDIAMANVKQQQDQLMRLAQSLTGGIR